MIMVKSLLKKYNAIVEVLKPKEENLDIDSKSDYKHLLNRILKSE